MMIVGVALLWGCGEKSDPSNEDSAAALEPAAEEGEPAAEPAAEGEPGAEPASEDEPGAEPASEDEPSSEPASEDTAAPEDENAPLAIVGIYYDQYATEHSITQNRWLINVEGPEEYVYSITQYSNQEGYIIASNQSTDPGEDGFWSRIDYIQVPSGLQACHTTYSAATEDEAFNTPASDPAGACTGYTYTLTRYN